MSLLSRKPKTKPNLHNVTAAQKLSDFDASVFEEANRARMEYVRNRTPENRRRKQEAELVLRQRTRYWREVGEAAGTRNPGGGPHGEGVVNHGRLYR